jgi:hypothetical protein
MFLFKIKIFANLISFFYLRIMKELKGEGKRLAELLGMQFDTQQEAADFLGLSQSRVNILYGMTTLPPAFWQRHANKLPGAGLNPAYISDPENQAPMFEEAAEAFIAKWAEKLRIKNTSYANPS